MVLIFCIVFVSNMPTEVAAAEAVMRFVVDGDATVPADVRDGADLFVRIQIEDEGLISAPGHRRDGLRYRRKDVINAASAHELGGVEDFMYGLAESSATTCPATKPIPASDKVSKKIFS